MIRPYVVLVEDEYQQAEMTREVLEKAGFEVLHFDSIAPARTYLSDSTELIDLFVLDRRLPVKTGQLATDEMGDDILEQIREEYNDARIIVFTGNATIPHVQKVMQGGGQLPCRKGHRPIDRVTALQKGQFIEFKEEVERFRALLQSLEDIEVVIPNDAGGSGAVDKRSLRRLAFEYEGVSLSAHLMVGGLTDAPVWRCEIHRAEGHVATVIAKRVKSLAVSGGLPEVLPRVATTAKMATVSGLMQGCHLNVLQLAGESPYALMDELVLRPSDAVDLARPVWEALSKVGAQQKTLALADLCSPLIAWEQLSRVLQNYGLSVPPGSLTASTRIGLRHCDLHPGNILIDDDSAVLIDFDSEEFAAGVLDPITMMISTLVHPGSPIRGSGWPNRLEIEQYYGTRDFGVGHACEAWFGGVYNWVQECQSSEREFWAVTLAYAARQLGYQDVRDDPATVDRVVALASRAVRALSNS